MVKKGRRTGKSGGTTPNIVRHAEDRRIPHHYQNFAPPKKILEIVRAKFNLLKLFPASGKKTENFLNQLMNTLPRLIAGAQNSGTQQISIPLNVTRQSEPNRHFILVLTVKGNGQIEFHEQLPK